MEEPTESDAAFALMRAAAQAVIAFISAGCGIVILGDGQTLWGLAGIGLGLYLGWRAVRGAIAVALWFRSR